LQGHRQFQGEAQLSGLMMDDRLDWTLGAFYYDSNDRSYYPTNFDAFAEPNPPIFPNGLLPNFVADDRYTDENKSGFLHAAYKLTDKWSFSGGVRYTSEDKSNTFQHYGQIVITTPKTLSASRWDYNATVDYQITPDMMVYGSFATGFRSPGFVPRISTVGQLVAVPGEEANQYELGSKMDFLGHRLRVNTSLFYIDYSKNLAQTLSRQCNLASDPNAGTPYPTTQFPTCPAGTPLAGTPGISPWFVYTLRPAIIRGAEMQVMATPVDRLTVNYSVGYNRIRRADIDPSVRQQPDTNMSAGIQYAFLVGTSGASLTPRFDAFYQSYQTNGATALPQRPDWRIPGYVLYNARLTFIPGSGGWQVDAGAENLFDKFYWQQLGAPTTATGTATVARVGTPGRPREWFVSLKKSF
jgi:iron complex outermembrane recepter protein